MKRAKSSPNKTSLIIKICTNVVLLSLFVSFSFLFVIFAVNYSNYEIDYDDLTYKELTFERYEKVGLGAKGIGYAVYFKEYSEPFIIDSIRATKLDSASLKKLQKNEILKVCFSKASHKNYEYEIYEVSCNSITFLSLSDYVGSERSNSFLGMILFPVAALVCLYPICRQVIHYYRVRHKQKST